MVTEQNETSIRILIVDDTAQVRQDLRTVLPLMDKEAGVNLEVVGEAADGWEAIRMAAALKPDVILMDLAMPVLDGFTTTMKIKAGNPHTRVVILTVYNDEELREKAEIAGADDFVEKGAPLNRLYNAIATRAISKEN
jgi:NarL family two-component system response regulator LiaR